MTNGTEPEKRIQNFAQFWPYYLDQHRDPRTRRLHFCGTSIAIVALFFLIITANLWLIPLVILSGYGPAWVSHFRVEKNRPATWTYPLYSLRADLRMWWRILMRRPLR